MPTDEYGIQVAKIAQKAHRTSVELGQREVLIQRLVAGRGVSAVHWVVETTHPGKGGIASLGGDYVRMFVVVQGRRHVRFVKAGATCRLTLGSGECLVMGPHSWLVTEVAAPFVSLGVALEARNPRFVLARHVAVSASGRGLVPGTEVAIAPGLCDDITMQMGAALLAARSDASSDIYARRLAESLWLRVTRYSPPLEGAERRKASVTYGAAEHFVRENLSRPIDREQVARFLRISPSHITRLFLTFAGESFGGFLSRVRLEGARRLLLDPRLTVSEIAHLTGFSSVNYFVRAYRRRYRVTPGRDRGRRA